MKGGVKFELRIVAAKPFKNRLGELCGLCDGKNAHEHPQSKCTICGVVGLAENMTHHTCNVQWVDDIDDDP